jgi:PAS domain S-box-containing protein
MSDAVRVLILDDDPQMCTTLRDILELKGFAVVLAGSGAQALQYVQQDQPAVVLIDLQLEDMNGLDVLGAIRETSPDVECIMLTGHASKDSAIQAANLGAYSYFEKPIDIDRLTLAIRRAAEKYNTTVALRESEARYRMLAENMSDTVWLMDMNLKDIYISPSVTRLRGYTLDELNALPLDQQMPPDSLQKALQALTEELSPEKLAHKDSGISRTLELEFYKKDGTKFWSENNFDLIFDASGAPAYILGTGRDISERKKTEAKLHQRILELEVLYESGINISRLQDPQVIAQRIIETLENKLSWHHIAIRIYEPETQRLRLISYSQPGMSQEDLPLIIKRLDDLVPDSNFGLSGWVIQQGKSFRSGNVRSEPHFVETYPGIQSGIYAPIQAGGRILGVITVEDTRTDAFTDDDERLLTILAAQAAIGMENARLFQTVQKELSDRLRIEEDLRKHQEHLEELVWQRTIELETKNAELQQSEKELRNAMMAADAANRAKSDFLANMSHEIRTPMNAVLGLTSLALNTDLNPQQYDYLSKIQISAQSLLKIINNILDLSKIEAGKLELEISPFDLDSVLDQLAVAVNSFANDKPIEIIYQVAPEVPRALVGDSLRLLQVLNNLGSNAVKFTETGEVVFSIKLLSEEDNHVTLQFTIQDSGIGIQPENLVRIFDIFTQADTSTTRKFGGTGLGLAISRRLIEIMGGQISVESQPGKGSVFSFNLQFETCHQKSLFAPPDERALERMNVLVVAKNPLVRGSIQTYLQLVVGSVSEAVSGEQALKILATSASENPYDLLIIDATMLSVAAAIISRQVKSFPGVYARPSILVISEPTNNGNQGELSDVDGWLSKPFSQSALLKAILLAMQKTRETRNLLPLSKQEAQSISEKARVLVVEDNEINQVVAQELLASLGLKATIASSGQYALDQLGQSSFDIVLMDIQMPDMDGYETTRLIRQNPTWQNLPVIAMTAHALSGDREKSLAAGMNDHITKPINVYELKKTLEYWLARSKGKSSTLKTISLPDLDQEDSNIGFPDLPGFDITSGLHRMGGDQERYRKLLLQFQARQSKTVHDTLEALDAGDLAFLEHRVHTLKGLAGNIGAINLHQSAVNLEASLRQANTASLKELVTQLNQDLQNTCDVISQLAIPEEPVENEKTIDELSAQEKEKLERLLQDLVVHLSASDLEAMDTLEALQNHVHACGLKIDIQPLEHCIEDYDFENALRCLAEISEAQKNYLNVRGPYESDVETDGSHRR